MFVVFPLISMSVRPDVVALRMLRAAVDLITSVEDSVRMSAISTNTLERLNCSEVTLHTRDNRCLSNVAFN